jgi:ubiquitin C-terminal hydrolase
MSWTTSNSAYGSWNNKQKEKEKNIQKTNLEQQYNIYDNRNIQKNENLINRNQKQNQSIRPSVQKPNKNLSKNNTNLNNPKLQYPYKNQANPINEPKLNIIFDPNKIITSKIGLQNLGNTCYMNSLLQILIHCPLFIYKFLDNAPKFFQNGIRPTPISHMFYELILNISNEQNTSFSPSDFKDSFTSLHPEFFGNLEHDTQEFCRFLLQDFNKELNIIENPTSYKEELKILNKKQMFMNYQNYCNMKESSIITDLFIGYYSYEFICQCNNKDYNFSQFLDIDIQFPKDNISQRYKLNELLYQNFNKTEYIQSNENCRYCRRKCNLQQKMKIGKLPQILILSLQRINQYLNIKNESYVHFDEMLDMRNYIDNELEGNSLTKYKLFAITNHIGNLNTGHYYSYIKINNEWYYFTDSKVIKNNPDYDSNEFYTLFYIRLSS